MGEAEAGASLIPAAQALASLCYLAASLWLHWRERRPTMTWAFHLAWAALLAVTSTSCLALVTVLGEDKEHQDMVRGLALAGWIGILTLSAQLVALMLLVVAAAACPRKGKEISFGESLSAMMRGPLCGMSAGAGAASDSSYEVKPTPSSSSPSSPHGRRDISHHQNGFNNKGLVDLGLGGAEGSKRWDSTEFVDISLSD